MVGFVALLKIRIVYYWIDGLRIGWIYCIGWIVSLYRCIAGYGWIWIVSSGLAGLDRLDLIGYQFLDEDT